ncbi:MULTISPECIES: hypothetical protein [Paenibacillus]|uniref:hypothetical protein n=1 Tax=Paenibacillus TaxID=44249 RepID=UPI0022B91EF1|nr:hypothetical protein [Paenibacillus caseinilyticus]MCZ8518098.1 hypothetical protein [Paenibacillus caseinilyticus]
MIGVALFYSGFYLILWTLLLSLGLALFRLRIASFIAPLMISVLPLSFISVLLQLLDKAYLTSIIQPVGAVLCYGLIFRFRWWHSILMVVLYYPINIFFELFFNFVMTSFLWDRVVHHMVKDDLVSVGVLLLIGNFMLIWFLQRYRLGFTFIEVPPSHARFKKFSDQMLAFLLAAFAIFGIVGFAMYFLNTFVMIFIGFALTLVWLWIIRLAYRAEIMD